MSEVSTWIVLGLATFTVLWCGIYLLEIPALIKYIKGQIQYCPEYLSKFRPMYIGNHKWEWLGFPFTTPNSRAGDTFFMAIQREKHIYQKLKEKN